DPRPIPCRGVGHGRHQVGQSRALQGRNPGQADGRDPLPAHRQGRAAAACQDQPGRHCSLAGDGRHLPTDDQHQGEARRRIQDLQVPAEDRETACAVEVHPRGRTGLAEEEQAHRSLDVPRVPRADGGGADRARAAPDHGREEDRRALLIAGRSRLEDADDRAAVAALRASKQTIAVRRRASRPAVRQAADAGASANSRATVHKVGRVRSNQVAQPTRCCRSKNRTFKLRNVGLIASNRSGNTKMDNRNAPTRVEGGRELGARRSGDLLVIEPELAEAVREVIGSAESPNTRRAYAAQAAKFEAWCKCRRTSALPASPAVVATYLVDLAKTGADPGKPAKGAKVATVGLALSAIAAAHRTAGHTLETRSREIRAAMKGIRKTYAAPQAQAEALKPAIVRGILATLGDAPLDRRDAAPGPLLFAGALRRSGRAGLDYAAAGAGDGTLPLTTEAAAARLPRPQAPHGPAAT